MNFKIKNLFLLFSFFLCLNSLKAEEKMRIAVLDLKADGVSERHARTISNMLRNEFINMFEFIVVERNQMDEILKEQGLQQTGCTEQACAVEIGKLISARKMLVGEVMPLGESFVITVRIVDVEKGISQFAAKDKAENEDYLYQTTERIAKELAMKINNYDYEKESDFFEDRSSSPSKTGYYLRGIVPGWGQFYADYNFKGFVYLSSFVVASGLTFFTYKKYQNAKDDYDALDSSFSDERFDESYDDYDQASKYLKGAGILLGTVYLLNWIDLLFISEYKPERDLSFQSEKGFFYSLNFYDYPLEKFNDKKINLYLGVKF